MSGKFDGLKGPRLVSTATPIAAPPATSHDRPSRVGKKVISGHFSPELSRALNMLAIEEDVSVQSLIGEALDLLLRQRGKHPFGER